MKKVSKVSEVGPPHGSLRRIKGLGSSYHAAHQQQLRRRTHSERLMRMKAGPEVIVPLQQTFQLCGELNVRLDNIWRKASLMVSAVNDTVGTEMLFEKAEVQRAALAANSATKAEVNSCSDTIRRDLVVLTFLALNMVSNSVTGSAIAATSHLAEHMVLYHQPGPHGAKPSWQRQQYQPR